MRKLFSDNFGAAIEFAAETTWLQILLMLVVLLPFAVAKPAYSQTTADLPDAPTPNDQSVAIAMPIESRGRAAVQPQGMVSNAGKWAWRISQVTFIAGFMGDSISTLNFLHHPEYARYRLYCYGSTGVPGDCGQWYYGYFPGIFVESGPAVSILKIGDRNTPGIMAAGLIYAGGVIALTEWMHRSHHRELRITAEAINTGLGSTHVWAFRRNKKSMDQIPLLFPSGAYNIQWYNP